MFARLRQFANTTLGSTIIGTVIGGLILAWVLKINWPDVRPHLANAAGYLSATVQVHRWSLLVLLVGLLVLPVAVAYVMRWLCGRAVASALRAALKPSPKEDPKPKPAPPPPATVPDDFKPTKRQAAAAAILGRNFPSRLDLDDVYSAMLRDDYSLHQAGVTRAEVATDLEVLAAANIVRIDSLTDNFGYYHLTKPGRLWVNQLTEKERARRRRSDDFN